MADAHAVALQRATTAERDLAQARTTLARTPSEDARRAFHSELESIRETARAVDVGRDGAGAAAPRARALASSEARDAERRRLADDCR